MQSSIFKKLALTIQQKTAVFFSGSSILLSVTKVLAGLIIIRWIEPEDMGLWNSLLVIPVYSSIFHLGIISGLNRELPFELGKGNTEKGKEMAATTKWFIYCWIIIFGVVTLGALLYFSFIDIRSAKFNISLVGVGLMICIQLYNSYLGVTFRAQQSFNALAKVYLRVNGVIIATLALPYFFSYAGLVARAVANSFFTMFLTHIVRPIRVRAAFSKKIFVDLIKTGLPIYSLGYFQEITNTFSRIILLHLGGVVAVGYFVPAQAVLTGMAMIPAAIGQYIYPQMSFNLGKHEDPQKLWQWVWKPAGVTLILGALCAVVGWFLIPIGIEVMFPKYQEGTFAAQLALLAGTFSAAVIGINVLNSLKAWKWLIFVTVFRVTLFGGTIYVVGSMTTALDGVAIGLLISEVVYFIVGMTVCYIVTHSKSYRKA